MYGLYGPDCVNEAIIHIENENHSTLEAHLVDNVLGQAIHVINYANSKRKIKASA